MSLKKGKEILVRDIKMNYYEKGSGDVLLFIHGNNSSSFIFSKMYEHFSKKYKVIALDSRGHGKSTSGNTKFSVELFAKDVKNFCKAKGLSKVSFVGYSDGANIALTIASKYPDLTEKVILICGNYKLKAIKPWFRFFVNLGVICLKPFTKIIRWAKLRRWKLLLMLEDKYVSKKRNLRKIKSKELIIAAKYDIVQESHTICMHKNIKNSVLKIINKATHFNILYCKETIEVIDKFLAE